MELRILSDRLRIDPQTGQITARDVPVSDAALQLEANFEGRPLVRMPRGGVASFQVVISLDEPGDGAELDVKVGSLTSDGTSLPEASVCYEWPCQLEDGSWVFDGLIPVEIYASAAAEVRAGPLGGRRHHAFWVDIPVPRDAKPGTYRGSVAASGAGQREVAVEVLPLELPLVPRVTVDLNSYAKRIEEQFPGIEAEALIACEHSYYREAHDNRAVFHYLGYGHTGKVADGYAPALTGRGRHLRVASWEAYDRRFGPLFDGTALAGSPGGARPIPHFYLPFNYDWPADFAYFGTRGYGLEWTRVLAQFRCHCQEKGWTQTNFEVFNNQKKRYRFFAWDGDESKSWADRDHFIYFRELLDRSARMAGPAGARARIIYRTDSSWIFLQDAIHEQVGPLFDLWVINIGNYVWSREGVQALKSRGQLAWTYGTADEGGHPAQPVLDLDRAVISTWRRGADGVLPNWLSTGTNADLDRANPLAMLYPGQRFGAQRALGSIRLRAIRRATQTADVLELLGDRGRELLDGLVGAKEEDWWTPTPAWALFPPELLKGEMYGWQRVANPFAGKDSYLPALIAQQATELVLGGE